MQISPSLSFTVLHAGLCTAHDGRDWFKEIQTGRSEQQNDNGSSQTLLQRWHSGRDKSGYARLV